MFRFVFSVPLLLATAVGCAHIKAPVMAPVLAGSCRSETLRWFAPSDDDHRHRLDSWCAGVGPAVLEAPASQDSGGVPVELEDVTFVSWNVHVGNGDIAAFVEDLRAGTLTDGRPVRHFVLMLQEAVRLGAVPPLVGRASGARRISADDASSIDIVDISRQLGLSLLYVPSMRNGNSSDDAPADRGSALLSTLPLSDPTAVELPGERQRRVAIMAKLTLASADTAPLSVGVLHLDALGASKRLWVFGTSWMRNLQVKSIESLLPDGNLVLGADLNTWHGTTEPAARSLARLFADTEVSGAAKVGLGLRVLDYMFFRVSNNRFARYEMASQDYGSDHRPLLGRITRSSPSQLRE
jgi:endonuclease/exonuclease/phosphatase family metal-dependent hydrolase